MTRGQPIPPRELAYCGLFGAAALLLPAIFHLIHLGHVFMPMYLPIVALAFFVRPVPAAMTAAVTPLLSGAVTGMPPFFPPVAAFMAIELAFVAALIATAMRLWPRLPEWLALIPVLLAGRLIYLGLVYICALFLKLPAGFLAGVSLLSGWPGLVLMALVIPAVVRAGKMTARRSEISKEGNP